MNYKKLSYLPTNMLLSIPLYIVINSVLNILSKDIKALDEWSIILISFALYLKDALNSADKEFLYDEIIELKNKLEK